jgi:hypothetical protein
MTDTFVLVIDGCHIATDVLNWERKFKIDNIALVMNPASTGIFMHLTSILIHSFYP